ncbi:hypothetical protein ACIGQC_29730 [Streptomyces albidoflavus]
MTVARERIIGAAALVLAVLVMATSVEVGRTALDALLTAATSYGLAVLAAALAFAFFGAPVSIRPVLKATRTLMAVGVVIGLVLFGMGKALVEVFS